MILVDSILNALTTAADKVFPDATKALEAKQAIAAAVAALDTAKLQAEVQLSLAQTNINLADAQSGNMWQSGWRPACGWMGALALLYSFLLAPLLIACGVQAVPIDNYLLLSVLGGMLGLRTVEKIKGVA